MKENRGFPLSSFSFSPFAFLRSNENIVLEVTSLVASLRESRESTLRVSGDFAWASELVTAIPIANTKTRPRLLLRFLLNMQNAPSEVGAYLLEEPFRMKVHFTT